MRFKVFPKDQRAKAKCLAAGDATTRMRAASAMLGYRRSKGLIPAILTHIQVHASNRHLVYGTSLHQAIPASPAGNAFVALCRATYEHELIKLVTFWDKPDLHSFSLPTIAELLIGEDVAAAIRARALDQYKTMPSIGHRYAEAALRKHRAGLRMVDRTFPKSDVLHRVKNARNRLAHPVERTRGEHAKPIAPMRYGEERLLLKRTIFAVDRLYTAASGSQFMWDRAFEDASEDADALWHGLTFTP